MPNTLAWNSKGHQAVVETMYYAAEFELQKKLNLTLLKEGSTAPDLVFHDVRSHHYPKSYPLAEKWINDAKKNYENQDYNEASYAFGVASHYISDSFVSPHYLSKEPGSLHSEFERIKSYNLSIKCYNSVVNLNESLKDATRNREDWTNWSLTKDPNIPRRELEQAINLTFPVFLTTFNSTCNNFKTEIIKQNFKKNDDVLIFISLTFISYLSFILNRRYKMIKRIRF